MAYERFTDRKDALELIKKSKDFKTRRHGIPPAWIIYTFIAVIVLVIILIIHLSIRLIVLPDNAPTPILEIVGFLVSTVFLVTVAAVFASSLIYRIRDTIYETEFLSLVFATSARLNTEFCFVTNNEKDVIYYDHNFDVLFPKNDDHKNNYDRFSSNSIIKPSDADKIADAITKTKYLESSANIKGKNILIKVESLERPAGYSIIRGYTVKS